MLTGFYSREKLLLFQAKWSTNQVKNKFQQIKVASSVTKTSFNSKHKWLPFKAKANFTQGEKGQGLLLKEKLASTRNKNRPPDFRKLRRWNLIKTGNHKVHKGAHQKMWFPRERKIVSPKGKVGFS